MKKIVLIAAFALFSIYGFSQNALYGVRAGYNISNLDFEPNTGSFENSHRNGFAIGFFAEFNVTEDLSFAPEIQFSAEGAKEEVIRIDYIQMPLFLKYKVGENLSVGLGPQISLKGHDFQDGLQNFAFSGLAGVEYMISDEFFLDLRYSYGFTNIFDEETTLDATNTNIQIGFGVKL